MIPWEEIEAAREREDARRESLRWIAVFDQLFAEHRERLVQESLVLIRCGFPFAEQAAVISEGGTTMSMMPKMVLSDEPPGDERLETAHA